MRFYLPGRVCSIPAIARTVVRCGCFLLLFVDAGSLFAVPGEMLHVYPSPTQRSDDRFGQALAIASNGTMLVGTSYNAVGGRFPGAVVQYDLATRLPIRTILNPTPVNEEYFGQTIAAGATQFAVTAPYNRPHPFALGTVYLFDNDTGEAQRTINNPTPGDEDRFGWSMAFQGTDILIGAWGDSTRGTEAGVIYRYDTETGALRQTYYSPNPVVGERCGFDIELRGDDLLMSCLGTPQGAAASVYLLDAATGAVKQRFLPTDAEDYGFGEDVAVGDDGSIVISATSSNTGGRNTGAVHEFDGDTGELKYTYRNPTAEAFDRFGTQVALAGKYLYVSAEDDDSAVVNNGSAYVFDRTNGILVSTLQFRRNEGGAHLGQTMALYGNRVFLGAPDDGVPTNGRTGVVREFEGPGQLSGIAQTSFVEPPDDTGTFVPGEGQRELGFATTIDAEFGRESTAGTHFVYPSPINMPLLLHRTVVATTAFDAVDLRRFDGVTLHMDLALSNTDFEADDFVRVYLTNGRDQANVIDLHGGAADGLNELDGNEWYSYSFSIPDSWRSAALVIETASNAEYYMFDSIRFVGEPVAIPEPGAVWLLGAGAPLCVWRHRRRGGARRGGRSAGRRLG
jgi:hypothetical protein